MSAELSFSNCKPMLKTQFVPEKVCWVSEVFPGPLPRLFTFLYHYGAINYHYKILLIYRSLNIYN